MTQLNKHDFIIIHGCPRSGTYLLVQQLQQYFDVAIPVETHFIAHFDRFVGLWGDLEKLKNRQRLLDAIECYLRIWTVRGIRSAAPGRQVDYSLIPALSSAPIEATDYAGLVHGLYAEFSRMHEGRAYGDKSAPYEPVDPIHYQQIFGRLKIIHIVRDGRDVCVSWRRQWFGPKSVSRAARLWKRYVSLGQDWGRGNPEHYLEISFEDLVRRNADIRKQLGQFLGLIENKTPRPGKIGEVMAADSSHKKLGDKPDARSIGQWRSQMGNRDLSTFDRIAGDVLSACGYDADDQHSVDIFEARASKIIVPITGLRNWVFRRLRAVMPVGIRMLQLVRIDVVKLAKFMTRH